MIHQNKYAISLSVVPPVRMLLVKEKIKVELDFYAGLLLLQKEREVFT